MPRSPKTRAGAPTSPIEEQCADRGLRLTGQRRVIARVLAEAGDHPDVEEVYRRAVAVEPGIALSTVYRTVKLFEDHGIVERHEFQAGPKARFEPASGGHHDHLIDTESGAIIEFCSPEIEALQEAVARALGFKLVGHRLQLYGVALKRGRNGGRGP